MPKENFDKFVENLQQEIIEKELEEYNERIINLFHNPKNFGRLPEEEISVTQSYKGPCGDTMHFFIKINGDVIERMNFLTDGCGASVATASQMTLLTKGKTLNDAISITPEEIDDALGGLPEDHKHCTELAVRTLRRAINKYKNKLKEEL